MSADRRFILESITVWGANHNQVLQQALVTAGKAVHRCKVMTSKPWWLEGNAKAFWVVSGSGLIRGVFMLCWLHSCGQFRSHPWNALEFGTQRCYWSEMVWTPREENETVIKRIHICSKCACVIDNRKLLVAMIISSAKKVPFSRLCIK